MHLTETIITIIRSFPLLELPQNIMNKLNYLCHELIEYLIKHMNIS